MILGREDPKDKQRQIMKDSKKQELRSAKAYNGSRNAGSGSGWMRKNDVRTHDMLIENKLTYNEKSYSIKAKELQELTQRAVLEDRLPVLQFDIGGRNYVILNEADFQMIIGEQ
ncbi:hypothetical protein UFOVP629_39 [uncultured Caudovirales phage]|uniref:Uncharacterized protein n=1 Tax=uncultured Caudovirales phage TaxID=2100421 RepID=A0A6J5NB86_9CAUD|nr:hypothetical protein UFOVP629_39 [uncultured Caudovirales phage]